MKLAIVCSVSRRLALFLAVAAAMSGSFAQAQRLLGIDVSDWQGPLSQANWNTIHAPVGSGGGGKDFAFIRATRGGTTGFYDETDAANNNGLNTLSQRYDDLYFTQNMNRATTAGMFVGPYHFGRADIIATTLNANGIPNNGTDEANHMLEIAGPFMKPGYLRPVFDLEAGASQRTTAELTQFARDFADRIYAVKGIYPLCYVNSSYANNEVSGSPNGGVTVMDQWLARWPNQADPNSIDVQNIDPPPAAGYPNAYGVWNPSYPNTPNPHPWKFWQYASTGRVPGIGNGSVNVDLDVAHGDIEFLKDFLVPALWQIDGDGSWTTATNWNSNPGLPGPNDRVIIDRTAVNLLVSLPSGNHSVRSLLTNERFTMSGGSLAVQQYANFNNTTNFTGGNFTAGSVTLASTATMSKGAGSFTTGSFINNGSFTQTAGTANFGSITGTGSLSVPAGLFIANSIRQNALQSTGGTLRINSAGTTSVVNSLSITGTAKLDLTTRALVVNYPGSSPINAIKSAITSGYAGGAWTGNGINSSSAAALSGAPNRTAIGFAEASEIFTTFPASFRGVTGIDSTSILIAYTAYGDANLSGNVDTSDFNLLSANFGGTGKRWSQADFNFDGAVDSQDFNALAANFTYTIPADSFGTLIPEPSGLLLLVSTSAMLRRRRSS